MEHIMTQNKGQSSTLINQFEFSGVEEEFIVQKLFHHKILNSVRVHVALQLHLRKNVPLRIVV